MVGGGSGSRKVPAGWVYFGKGEETGCGRLSKAFYIEYLFVEVVRWCGKRDLCPTRGHIRQQPWSGFLYCGYQTKRVLRSLIECSIVPKKRR